MDLAIIGTGYVGLTTGACLASIGHRVWCYDIDQSKVERIRRGEMPIFEEGLESLVKAEMARDRFSVTNVLADAVRPAEAVFICVPTPTGDDGSANLAYLEGSVREVAKAMEGYKVIIEKSTSPVQTAKGLKRIMQECLPDRPYDVAVNPEFLREGTAIKDFLNPDRIVVGVETERARAVMERIYESFQKKNVPIYWTDLNGAELVKHASNAFLALKISYVNLLAELCAKTGADVSQVADAIGSDKRIGRAFLDAGLGYGGSCFPKDLAAFRWVLRQHGIPDDMLEAVSGVNDRMPAFYVGMAEQAIGSLQGRALGLWGLAFKPNTDDMREARSVPIIRELHRRGAVMKAYDPQAMRNAKAILEDPSLPPDRRVPLTYCADPYTAAQGVDAVLLLTEWDEFRKADLKRLRQLTSRVIDGRNLYSPKAMRELGFTYRSIGRP
jgi:UDPglucose 6-dehydrogenase